MPNAPNDPPKPEKKPLTLSEDDIRTERRTGRGSVGHVGGGGPSQKVIDPNQRGPGLPSDPDA